MKTFTVYSARAGETWMPNWKPISVVRGRGVDAAAKKYFTGTRFRKIAQLRFTDENRDFIFAKQ